MAMSKDEAVATLKAMFDEWDMLSLADAVDMAKGNLDMACEIILSAGSVEGLRKMKADNAAAAAAPPQQPARQPARQSPHWPTPQPARPPPPHSG